METLIKVLNAIIAATGIATDAIVQVLDRTIVVIQNVSKRIITLFLDIFRLLFYLFPFVLFVSIGASKHWWFLSGIGIFFLIFGAFLFIRDFLVAFKSKSIEDRTDAKTEKAGTIIVIMVILNIVTVGYAVLYYFFDISIEQVIGPVLRDWVNSIMKSIPPNNAINSGK